MGNLPALADFLVNGGGELEEVRSVFIEYRCLGDLYKHYLPRYLFPSQTLP